MNETTHSTAADSFASDGVAIVRGLWERDHVDLLAAACERILAQWRFSNPETNEPGGGELGREEQCVQHEEEMPLLPQLVYQGGYAFGPFWVQDRDIIAAHWRTKSPVADARR